MTIIEKGEMISFDHSSELGKLGTGDIGGPFWSSQTFYRGSENVVQAQGLGRLYEGTVHCWAGSSTGELAYPLAAKPQNFDSVVAAGAIAISRSIPTNPVAGVSVALGELREGAPKFITQGTLKELVRDYRKLGDNYLNVEFGWKPFLSDLFKFTSAMKESNKSIQQLYRDSGTDKSVRRKYHFPTETSKSPISTRGSGQINPFMCDGGQLDAWMVDNQGQPWGHEWSHTTEIKTWFSGAFSYVMPPPPTNLLGRLRTIDAEANKLYGTRITPDTLWNLAPWSWAADWFGNTGDIMSNVSAFSNDSLVLKYGYVMRQMEDFNQCSNQCRINTPNGGHLMMDAVEQFGSRTKVRLQATPWGFGIEIGSLNPKQIAISAALGISRSPRLSL